MDWPTTLTLAAIVFALMIVWHRFQARRRVWLLAILILPTGLLLLRWGRYRDGWAELGTALGLGALAFAIWWGVYGRRIPAPRDEIRVITKEEDAP
jgi:hypothetical protein